MKIAPANSTEVLLEVCDELLAATGHLRKIYEKAGHPWPCSEAKRLINAVLDCRNTLSRPKPQTKPKHAN